jgi:AcrR family transcriptional regulator
MKSTRKSTNDTNILEAAESVFNSVGYKNGKMEDIALKAGITKVTLYSYYQSKENLYLALTYRALTRMIEDYYGAINDTKNKTGLDTCLALLDTFMTFCEKNHLYSELLLDYFALVRSTGDGTMTAKMTDAVKDSIYWIKLQDLHNLPFKLTIKEIERGKLDGSIQTQHNSTIAFMQGWSMVLGYVKLFGANGNKMQHIYNISISDLKQLNLDIARRFFQSKSFSQMDNIDLPIATQKAANP